MVRLKGDTTLDANEYFSAYIVFPSVWASVLNGSWIREVSLYP